MAPYILNMDTGKAHKAKGIYGDCGCSLMKEADRYENTKLISEEHLEEGIWEEADCLKEEGRDYDMVCPECEAHSCLVVSYTEDEVKECGHCGYGKDEEVYQRLGEMQGERA